MERAKDVVAVMFPYMAEELAPAEFKNELVLHLQPVARSDRGQDIRQVEDAMGDVGRQAGHRAVEGVATARIVSRAYRRQARECGGARRRECGQGTGRPEWCGARSR